jgi:hypothetical protein
MRLSDRITSALPALALAGCSTLSQPPPVLPEPYTALYLVKAGPYPLYAEARRAPQLQARADPADGPWLHSGCIFDVQRTSPDQQEASYLWAYGRVFRCDDVVTTGVVEPQMGIRPRELRIYDGSVGYFPMRLLDPYTGSLPPSRK